MNDVVTVTDDAKAHIEGLLLSNPGQHLRVSINQRGCSGHKYDYQLREWDDVKRFDEIVEWPGGRLVIDGTSLFGLIGSTLDLQRDQFQAQLMWHNPMAHNHCGCGESFQLVSDDHA